jgi:hypothetical protein
MEAQQNATQVADDALGAHATQLLSEFIADEGLEGLPLAPAPFAAGWGDITEAAAKNVLGTCMQWRRLL